MENKICPMTINGLDALEKPCRKELCPWWVRRHLIDDNYDEGCAITKIAENITNLEQ